MKSYKTIEIIADSARGVYIPKHFAEACGHWSGVSTEEFNILLAGPDSEFYWDVWSEVLDNAYCIEESTGREFKLWCGEGGDLFAYCRAEMSASEFLDFIGVEG